MPIYMDVHTVPGVSAKDVAEAHRMDVLVQDDMNCKCMTYWIDEGRENVFCLIEAPNEEAVTKMHRRSHGLIPNKIIEVKLSLVESFLGRIYDPSEAEVTEDGLKIFNDPSFRVLLIAKTVDPVLLSFKLGPEKANAILRRISNVMRKNLADHDGYEVEHGGTGIIISFTSPSKSVAFALAVHSNMVDEEIDSSILRMAINSGKPVEKADRLFGDTIQLAETFCSIAGESQVAVSSAVKEMVAKEYFHDKSNHILSLSPHDEKLLELLFNELESHWKDAEFNMDAYCHAMAMSKSQLYRKTIELTRLSPNALLNEYKLQKAKELLKKRLNSIAQITFESGFSSPSYFTKCFKKKYGLLPMAYLDLLN